MIDGRIGAIAERVPASVTGDGVATVEQLVDTANADPRRGVGREKVLTRIKVDDAAVELVREQGFAMTDVPPEGQMVFSTSPATCRPAASTSSTGPSRRTPENVEIAEEAAQMVGLDIAGVDDFISRDITEPVRETGGAICEINAAPGFRMHAHPTIGKPQLIAEATNVDMHFIPARERPRGSRSWPSPAPTARRPRRG